MSTADTPRDPGDGDQPTGSPMPPEDSQPASANDPTPPEGTEPGGANDPTEDVESDTVRTQDLRADDVQGRSDEGARDKAADDAQHSTPPPPGDPPPYDPPPGDPPPPGPGVPWPPPASQRRVVRRSDDRVLAGVASGIGDYFGVDPAIIRLAFVALLFVGGSGLLLYVLGWLFLPAPDEHQSIGEGLVRRAGGGRSAGGLVLILIALVIIVDSTRFFGGGLLWAALLIGAGVLLFRNSDQQRPDGPAGVPSTSDQTGVSAAASSGAAPAGTAGYADPVAGPASGFSTGTTATLPPADPYPQRAPMRPDDWRPTPQPPPPPRPPRPPSILGRITVAAALILIGAIALIDNLSGLTVSFADYAALALTVVGVGLVVGTRWGRARGLVVLGVVLALAMSAAAAIPQLPAGAGQRTWQPQTVEELQRPYELGAGEMQIDLTELALDPGQRVDVDGTIGMGQMVVIVPDDVGVRIDALSRMGSVDALARNSDGAPARASFFERGEEGRPVIDLDLMAGMGEIEIHRAPAEVN